MDNPSLVDQMRKFFWMQLRGRKDFNYMTRGIRGDQDHEMLLVGPMSVQGNTVTIKPRMVIGSDRMELYEFFGRRKEMWKLQNNNWIKLAMGITGLHFAIVSVPELFSRFFGDEVGTVSRSMGAKDQSHVQK